MAGFNPDKFLAETAPKSQIFDPDKFLSETAQPKEESLGRRLTRSTLDTVLPVGGAVIAGLAATPESLGLATIPAGAAGYATGKQLSRVLKNYILGDDIGEKDAAGLVKQTANDLGEGAVMEAGGQIIGKAAELAGPYVSKGIKKTGEYLSDAAEKRMAKAVGAGAKEFERPTEALAIGRNALDKKILGPYTSAEDALLKATSAKESAGRAMDEVYSAVDKKLGPSISPLDTAVKVESELAPTYRTPINKSEVGQLENTIESILARGDQKIHLGDAQALKKEIDTVAFPKGKRPLDPTPKQQMAADASAIIRSQIDEAAQQGAEHLGSEDLVKKLNEARKAYGLNRQTEKLLTKKVGKEGAGIGTKVNWTVDPVRFGASLVKKVAPSADATSAIILDRISSIVKNAPGSFGNFAGILKSAEQAGPQHLAAMHAILEKTNPEYRQIIQKAASTNDQPPTKGPDKWANDGLKKIIDHDGTDAFSDPELVKKMMDSKKGKELLIKASDLKPNSKAMEDVVGKIRTSFLQGGE